MKFLFTYNEYTCIISIIVIMNVHVYILYIIIMVMNVLVSDTLNGVMWVYTRRMLKVMVKIGHIYF